MPKRFTETDKWRKTWFRNLSCAEKAAWFYITESCDAVGVWDADTELAEYLIGEKIDWKGFVDKTNGNIEVLQNGKWWLVDFCEFQYKDLSEHSESRPIQSYIRLLKKHGLWGRFKGLPKGMDSVQEQEKEKDKIKKKTYAPAVSMTEKEYAKLVGDYGQTLTNTAVDILSNWKKAKGKTYKSDYHAILTWAMEKAGGKSREELKIPPRAQHCPKCGKSLANEIKNRSSHCYSRECGADIRSVYESQ